MAYRNYEVNYPNNIARIRMSKNLTQKVIGLACEVAPNTIARWERGQLKPNKRHARRLARVLGVTVAQLALHNQGTNEQPNLSPWPEQLNTPSSTTTGP